MKNKIKVFKLKIEAISSFISIDHLNQFKYNGISNEHNILRHVTFLYFLFYSNWFKWSIDKKLEIAETRPILKYESFIK